MSFAKLMKSSGSALLAALLASTVLSASAHAEGERRGGGHSGAVQGKAPGGGGNWQSRRGDGDQWRGSSVRSEPRPQVDRAPRASSGRDFRNNGGAETARRGGWNFDHLKRGEQRTEAPRVARPTYTDRNRNPSYAAPERDRNWSSDRTRESLRDRDRTRWSSDRDGRRDRDGTRWSGDHSRHWDRDSRNWREKDRWNDRDRWQHKDRWSSDRRHGHRWSNDWRRDRRYDWYNYRNSYHHVYRPGPYYSPYRHHHYSRISIGFGLDSLFYSDRYWLSDPGYYRLPPAYGSYRWVRYYDDVLLVDIYTGEVVDVIHDFFW